MGACCAKKRVNPGRIESTEAFNVSQTMFFDPEGINYAWIAAIPLRILLIVSSLPMMDAIWNMAGPAFEPTVTSRHPFMI